LSGSGDQGHEHIFILFDFQGRPTANYNVTWFCTGAYKSAGSGGLLMAHDRIYFLDNNGHISDPPEEVECVDDQVAIETAIPLLNGRAIEVWEGPHLMTSRTRSQRNPNCSCLVQTGPLPKQVVDRRAPGAMGGRV
jgi:hypothetical protein